MPFVAAGGTLYDVFDKDVVGGLFWSPQHFRLVAEGTYETGGKNNDAVNTSSVGHTRALRGDLLFKVKGLEVGAGASWSKLYTPAYTKTHVHPRATVAFKGGDFVHLIEVSYVHPGTDWQNGVQGFEGRAWWYAGHHLFFRLMTGGYWCHVTLTDRTNVWMTKQQLAMHQTTGQFQMLAGYRF